TFGVIILNIIYFYLLIIYNNIKDFFVPLAHWQFLLAMLFLGVGCILITAQLMSYMMAHLEAVVATLFGNLATGISFIAGIMILNEEVRIIHVICGVLIIVGVIGNGYYSKKKESDFLEKQKKLSGAEQ
ncbi:MAG: EamA family transporter, partial [Anaerovoracaceae bacterium]